MFRHRYHPKKLFDILLFNGCGLLNQRSWIWHKCNVSFKNKLIFPGLTSPVDVFFTQDILDFNKRPVLNTDIDGEMSLHRLLSYNGSPAKALGRVLCMATDSVNHCQSFLFPHHLSTWSLFLRRLSSTLMWWKVPPQGSSGTRHNCASLQSDVDIFWNVDSMLRMVFILTVDAAKWGEVGFFCLFIWFLFF